MLNGSMLSSIANISDTFNAADVFVLLSNKYSRVHDSVVQQFGPNGMYLLGVFAVLILMILVIYIKSVLETFRHFGKLIQNLPQPGLDFPDGGVDLYSEISGSDEYIRRRLIAKPLEFQRSLPDDLETEELVKMEKEQELSRQLLQSSATTDDILNLKETLKRHAQKSQQLDWEKRKTAEQNNRSENKNLYYQQPQESLEELICLIINMLGRNVTPEKIAQAIYTRTKGKYTEEDILQLIQAVRDFIGLCNSGKFDTLQNRENLPLNNEALYNWALGDSSQCLELLEHLIEQQISSADDKNGSVKEMAYAQAASYACIFGTIASLNNAELAQNSFDLAIELSPKDVNAWSRSADMHRKANEPEKAIFAYQTVIENGDEIIYAKQKANANHYLADYYKMVGNYSKAENLLEKSRQFYADYGITNELTEKELQTLDFIAAQQNENLQSSITSVLQNKQLQYV